MPSLLFLDIIYHKFAVESIFDVNINDQQLVQEIIEDTTR